MDQMLVNHGTTGKICYLGKILMDISTFCVATLSNVMTPKVVYNKDMWREFPLTCLNINFIGF